MAAACMTSDEFYEAHMPAANTAAAALESIWNKPADVRKYERAQFAALKATSSPLTRAQLTNCYAWTQSASSVIFVVWIQGDLDATTVEVTEPRTVRVQTDDFAAVIDAELAHDVDPSADVDSVSWDELDCVAFKVVKAVRGERWERLFRDDSYMNRAPGLEPWKWRDDVDQGCLVMSVDAVDATVTIRRDELRIESPHWSAPLVKHFRYVVDVDESTWVRTPSGGVDVALSVVDSSSSNKDPAETKRTLFVENEDGMLTSIVAEIMASIDFGTAWQPPLSPLARHLKASLGPDHPYAFDDDDDAPVEPILDWWRAGHVVRGELADDDDDDEPVVEILDDDDDDLPAEQEQQETPLPPGGMLGLTPVKIAAEPVSSTPAPGASLGKEPPQIITDYAYAVSKTTVKVYIDVAAVAEVTADLSASAATLDVATLDHGRFRFATKLAQAIDPDRSSYKVAKDKTRVVLSLRRADPAVAWGESLGPDVNA